MKNIFGSSFVLQTLMIHWLLLPGWLWRFSTKWYVIFNRCGGGLIAQSWLMTKRSWVQNLQPLSFSEMNWTF